MRVKATDGNGLMKMGPVSREPDHVPVRSHIGHPPSTLSLDRVSFTPVLFWWLLPDAPSESNRLWCPVLLLTSCPCNVQ